MIIDVHSHAVKDEFWTPNFDELRGPDLVRFRTGINEGTAESWGIRGSTDQEKFIAELDEARVDKAVVMSVSAPRSYKSRAPLNYIADFVREHPDRLIGFLMAEPMDSLGHFNRRGLLEFERAVKEYAYKGLKFPSVYEHYYPTDRTVYPFLVKALELDIPVMFHIGQSPWTAASMKHAVPTLLDEVAIDFPELRIAIAHMGVPFTEECLATMQKHANMFMDISGLQYQFAGGNILVRNIGMAKEYNVISRLMFGTDYWYGLQASPPWPHPKEYIEWCRTKYNQKAEMTGWPTLSEEEIESLLSRNAIRYLGL